MMGLYDSFAYAVQCPGCGGILDNFQSKALGCEMYEYKPGDQLSTPSLRVLQGHITVYDWCATCERMIYLDIEIELGKLGKTLDMRMGDEYPKSETD